MEFPEGHTPLPYDSEEEIEKWRQERLSENPAPPIMDEFHHHEALDRTHMVNDTLERFVIEHPTVLSDPYAFRLAHQAFERLYNLYQYLGAKY